MFFFGRIFLYKWLSIIFVGFFHIYTISCIFRFNKPTKWKRKFLDTRIFVHKTWISLPNFNFCNMKKCISVLCIFAPCWVSGKIWWIKDILSVNDPEKISFTAVQLQNRNKWCQGQLKGQGQKTMIQFNCYQQYVSVYEVWWKYIAVLMQCVMNGQKKIREPLQI